jgi:hypothetical protein
LARSAYNRLDRKVAVMAKRLFLTDKEVGAVVELSPTTISRIVSGAFAGRKYRVRGRVVDLMDADPEQIGGARRWKVDRVASVLGISVEELIERIS